MLLSFEDLSGPTNSVSINPGDSFSFSIYLSSDVDQIAGVSYQFESNLAGSGLFIITARDISTAPFTASDLITPNASLFTGSNASLDPQVTVDLGASFGAIAPNTYNIGSYTLSSSVLSSPGSYTISFANALVIDQDFNEITPSLNTYTVTVVPEPATWALLAGSLTTVMIFRRRRQA